MTVQFKKTKYSTVEQLSCLYSVDEGPIKNSESHLFKCMYSSSTQLCVFRVCVCVRVGGWGVGGMGGGDLRRHSPVICKSHEL